ncbi:hypothetical protein, partial [Providencia rustigianii]
SDKLLKSGATFLLEIDSVFINLGRCREVAYITLSSVRVKHFFYLIFSDSLAAGSVSIALCVGLFPVSGCAL